MPDWSFINRTLVELKAGVFLNGTSIALECLGNFAVICRFVREEDANMGLLGWAIIALVISLIAGGLGFTGIAAGAATIARLLFGIFLVIAVILFAMLLFGIGVVA